jgi:DNA-binding CsgD family transcriptional regulator
MSKILMRMVNTGESDLLAGLYEGMFEQPLWHRFLEMLRSATGASYAALFFRPPEGPIVQLFAGRELPQHLQQRLFERYGDDPLPHRRMREGRVYALPELMDPNDAIQRSFVDEVLVPGGMGYLRSVRLTEAGGTDAWLTIVNDRDFSAATGSLLSRITRHVRIALHNFVALERERMRSSISSEMMGRLNFGWLTIDSRCRIVDQSPNVDEIFRRTSLLRHGRYDRLTFASASVDRDVAALIKAFACDAESRPRAFRLSQDPWMDIFVTPVHDRHASPGSNAAAIVYLSGDRWSRDDRCDQLTDLFGLLPSEARLAWAIAQGRSIAEAARELGITIETARNYSKKIYSKTGAGGQADLVRIIFTSVLAII